MGQMPTGQPHWLPSMPQIHQHLAYHRTLTRAMPFARAPLNYPLREALPTVNLKGVGASFSLQQAHYAAAPRGSCNPNIHHKAWHKGEQSKYSFSGGA